MNLLQTLRTRTYLRLSRSNPRVWLLILMFGCPATKAAGNAFIGGPTPQGLTETSNALPLLVKQVSMPQLRYQQVFNASLFTNVNPNLIYVTTLYVFLAPSARSAAPWTITNMQINLSATS